MKNLFGPQRRVVLFDWSNVVWRAIGVEAEPEEFLRLLLRMIAKYRKSFASFDFVFALEGEGVEARRRLWPAYKAQRAHHEQVGTLMGLAEQVLHCLAGTIIHAQTGEADDAIASYVERYIGLEDHAIIVSEDRDLWALVRDPSVEIHSTRLGAKLDTGWVLQKFGVRPAQVQLLKALLGDSSDNLPKVRGLSKSVAIKLIQNSTSLKELWRTIASATWLSARNRKVCQSCKKQVRINYKVCRLRRELKFTETTQRAKPKRLATLLITSNVFGTEPKLLETVTSSTGRT